MSVLALAIRNVTRNRRRSLLTGGVVLFGFAAIALAGGFMAQSLEGLREGTIRNGVGHLQLAKAAAFEPGGDAFENLLDRAAEVEATVRRDPAVEEVLPRIDFAGLVTSGTRSIPFLGTGLDPAREAAAMDLPHAMSDGSWLSAGDARGVVLGSSLAVALSVRVGDTVTLLATTADGTLNAVDAQVTGLADIPIRELSERFVATPIGLASELLGIEGRVSKLVVTLKDSETAPQVLLAVVKQLSVADGIEIEGRTWEQLATFYRQVRLLYFGIFGFMGAVLAAVVLLATANTMTMAASERTREIGTLRALGTRPSRIRAMFLAEGAVLALAGCVAGAVLALVVRLLLNHSGIVLPPPPGVSHGMPLHVKLYGAAYAAAAVAMLVTLLVASYFPARWASKIPIVEALSHV